MTVMLLLLLDELDEERREGSMLVLEDALVGGFIAAVGENGLFVDSWDRSRRGRTRETC